MEGINGRAVGGPLPRERMTTTTGACGDTKQQESIIKHVYMSVCSYEKVPGTSGAAVGKGQIRDKMCI